MEDTPINMDIILEQARDWTFDGDFRILQWMNKISQNLESKAKTTTENLDRLNNNVKTTHVALDNVANSLTALQYGNQFVECRVQDDDETSMGAGIEGMAANGIAESPAPSSKEVLAAFLHNNLKVLRNFHEKYAIDLDDSDEEDEKFKTTYIFKPLNPYNDKPLPHIVGSKEWSEQWHVGLGNDDQDNSYSGDDISDAYSESSSRSAAPDNESYETISEFASSVSLNNDNFVSCNKEKDVSSLRRNKFETVSETSSSYSSAAKTSNHKTQSRELNTEIPAASSSLNSSESKIEDISGNRKQSTNDAATVKNPVVSRSNVPPYRDLFSEPPEDLGSSSSTPSLGDFIQQKPINLFNDDVDDVYKHLAIAQSKRNEPPVAKQRSNVKAKPNSNEPSLVVPTPPATPETFVSKQSSKAHTGVLVLPHHKGGDQTQATGATSVSISKKAKNLFDDDQDDDDFLSAFVKKQEFLGNAKLLHEPSGFEKTHTKNNEKGDLFERVSNKLSPDSANIFKTLDSIESPKTQAAKTQKNVVNLFDDNEDDDVDVIIPRPSNNHSSVSALEKNVDTIDEDSTKHKRNLANIIKSTNLFDDDDDDDDDFFKTLPSKKANVSVQSYNKIESGPPPTESIKPDQTANKEYFNASSSVLFHSTENLKSHRNVDEKYSGQEGNTASVEKSSGLSVDTRQRDNENSNKLPKIFPSIVNEANNFLPKSLLVSEFGEKERSEVNNNFATNIKISANNNTVNSTLDRIEANKHNSESLNSLNKIAIPTFTNIFDDDNEDFMPALPPIPSTSGKQQKAEDQINDSFSKQEQNKEDIRPAEKLCEKEKLSPTARDSTSINTGSILDNVDKQDIENLQDEKEYEREKLTSNIMFDNEEGAVDTETVESLKSAITKNDLFLSSETKLDVNVEEPANLNIATEAAPKNIVNAESFLNEEISSSKEENQQRKEINATAEAEKINTYPPEDGACETISIMPQNKIDFDKDVLINDNISKDNRKSQTYDLPASFLFDEPPDDDDNEFFDTLGKSSHPSASKYINFDLEHDLYAEPEITKVPGVETVSSSTYGGLQLFDDVPPEDDEFDEVLTQKPETTKRLSTVFYDDFDETLEALNESKQLASTSKHSVLNNEPPPDMVNDLDSQLSKRNKNVLEILQEDNDNGELFVKKKIDDVENKSDLPANDIENPFGKNRQIAKLQLPKININVQSLLPSLAANPSRTKNVQNINKSLENVETDTKSLQIYLKDENSKPFDANHILPNVNKNRVRAPLNRRPSSRKARQENYRKSLLDEEQFSNDDNSHENKNQSNQSMKESELEDDKIDENTRKAVKVDLTTDISSTLLKRSKDTAADLKSSEKQLDLKTSNSAKSTMVNKEQNIEGDKITFNPPAVSKNLSSLPNDRAEELHNSAANLQNSATQNYLPSVNTFIPHITEQYKTNQAKNSASVFSDSESDDDLFSTLSTPLTKTKEVTKIDKPDNVALAGASLKTSKTQLKAAQNSLFSEESDGDDDFLKSTTQSKIISKSKPKPALQNRSIFSDTEDSDDDDLFGSKSKVIQKPEMNITLSNAAESSKSSMKQTIADNPLADLL